MTDNQTPAAADYRRAAQLYVARHKHDAKRFNNVLAETDQLGRLTALVLATINLARMTPGSELGTDEGITRMTNVAIEFGLREGITLEDLLGGNDHANGDDE